MGLLKMKIHQLETSEEGRFGIGQDSSGGLAWDQGIKALFHKTWKVGMLLFVLPILGPPLREVEKPQYSP